MSGSRNVPGILSRRERVVADAFARGDSYKQIARELGLSPLTVRSYLSNIYRKLGVSSKVALAQTLVADLDEAVSTVGPALGDGKPSIAVVPFRNLSAESDQDRFCSGVTDGIVTALACSPWLFVIGRNVTRAYCNENVDVRRISSELAASFILEGTVQRAGIRVRVTAQLIDGRTGACLWADRYDGHLDDVFELQDEVTSGVSASIGAHIHIAAVSDPIERDCDARPDFGIWDLTMRAWSLLYNFDADSFKRARRLLDRALELDPAHSEAHHVLSSIYMHEAVLDMASDEIVSYEQAYRHAERAVLANPRNEYGHLALGMSCWGLDRLEEAVSALTRAVQLNPNCSFAQASLGSALSNVGSDASGMQHLDVANRLDPRSPNLFTRHCSMAVAHFQAGRFALAETWSRQALRSRPRWSWGHFPLIASLAAQGKFNQAKAAALDLLADNPAVTLKKLEIGPNRTRTNLEKFREMLHDSGIPH